MSVSSTKHRFLSGGSQQIKASELSSQGITQGFVLAANANGTWTAVSSGSGGGGGPPLAHSASHYSGSTDPLDVTSLRAHAIPGSHLFITDKSGNGLITTVVSSTFAPTTEFNAFKTSINLFTASISGTNAFTSSVKSPILWKWNETDTSQFRIAHTRMGIPDLTVTTGSGTPALRVTFPSKSSGEHACFITISDFTASFVNTDYYRYELRFRMTSFSGTAGEWYSFGPAILCNSGTGATFRGLGYGYKLAVAARAWKVQNNALTSSGATPLWGGSTNPLSPTSPVDGLADSVEAKVYARHNTINSLLTFKNELIIKQPIANSSQQTGMRGDANWTTNQLGAFDATFHAHPLSTCGITWLGNTGLGVNQYFEFDNLCILRLPLDL